MHNFLDSNCCSIKSTSSSETREMSPTFPYMIENDNIIYIYALEVFKCYHQHQHKLNLSYSPFFPLRGPSSLVNRLI